MKLIKVCVMIPEERRKDLLTVAEEMRGSNTGWDAKAVNQIARERFGGLAGMFEHFGWPERGAKMMPAVLPHVVAYSGSVADFVAKESK